MWKLILRDQYDPSPRSSPSIIRPSGVRSPHRLLAFTSLTRLRSRRLKTEPEFLVAGEAAEVVHDEHVDHVLLSVALEIQHRLALADVARERRLSCPDIFTDHLPAISPAELPKYPALSVQRQSLLQRLLRRR